MPGLLLKPETQSFVGTPRWCWSHRDVIPITDPVHLGRSISTCGDHALKSTNGRRKEPSAQPLSWIWKWAVL